jgi:hypothetical protein
MDDDEAAQVRRGIPRDGADPAPDHSGDGHSGDEDGRSEDEVLRLDRELAVANDVGSDAVRRDRPGVAPSD